MSPITLGILAASGAATVGSYELITSTVLTGTAASLTFSNLNTAAAAYKHLQIRMVTQVTGSSGQDQKLRLNGVSTTGAYKDHYLYGFAGASTTGPLYSGTVYTDGIYVGSTYPSSEGTIFSPSIIDILDFSSSSKNTTIRALNGKPRTTDGILSLMSGVWLSTAAVTSVTVAPNSGTYQIGSRFSLYGLRG